MDIDRIDPIFPYPNEPTTTDSDTNQPLLVVPRVLVDFDVIATNGRAGRVHRDSATSGDETHLVVRMHAWPFGRKRSIPASAVKRISYGGRQIFVQMTKTQVKNAPQWIPRSAITAADEWGGHSAYNAGSDYDSLLRR
jgi:hypothetical protein